jgi:hypothetical protein
MSKKATWLVVCAALDRGVAALKASHRQRVQDMADRLPTVGRVP